MPEVRKSAKIKRSPICAFARPRGSFRVRHIAGRRFADVRRRERLLKHLQASPTSQQVGKAADCTSFSHSLRRKQNTVCKISCPAEPDRPIISAAALLKLAQWSRARREMSQGGEPCPPQTITGLPPAPTQPNPQPDADVALAGTAGGQPAASAADAEPHARSAAPHVTHDERGDV